MPSKRAILMKQAANKSPLKRKTPEQKPDENDIPEQEKEAVSKLLSEIDRAKTLAKDFIDPEKGTLQRLRRLTWGSYKAEKDEATVRTNMIFATQATLLPHIYAKNPEISVSPTEAVSPKEYSSIKDFAKSLELVVNKLLVQEAKLKRRMKSGVRSAMGTSVGWFKLSFQHSLTSDDPIILRRANDMQDNLQRIEYLIGSLEDETAVKTQNAKREELEQQLQSMLNADEVKTFKGFALDRVRTEDIFILDESIVEFDEYVSARKIAHRVFMSDDQFCEYARLEKVPKGATGYPTAGGTTDDPSAKLPPLGDGKAITYRAVYEVWDHSTNMVSVVCEGCKGYIRAPRVMKHSPERWLPFYCLGYNLVEGRWRPLSDVELLQYLQEEYNTTRFLYAEARKEAIPVRVFRKSGGLTEEDVERLSKRRARDFIGVEGNPTSPISNDLMQMEGVKIDPAAYDITLIRNDMDMMVGLSDASRASLIQAKTATEAQIMQQSLMNRVAERQDTTEDLITEMAVAVAEIAIQAFTKDEIEQLIGEGAVWTEALMPPAPAPAPAALDPITGQPIPAAPAEAPTPDIETIFRKVRVQVKAGTTGKPNQVKDRETWTQILPIIQENQVKVAELRAQGQFDLADSLVQLVKETLQRFDEKIDVDKFIPPAQTDDEGKPVQNQNAVMAAQQAQEQLQAMQQELQKCQQALQQCQMDLKVAQQAEQAKVAEVQAKQAIGTAQESAKGAAEQAKSASEAARAQADKETQIAKANIDANARIKIAQDAEAAETAREEKRLASQEEIARINAGSKVQAAGVSASAKAKSGGGGEAAGKPGGADEPTEPAQGDVAKMLQKVLAGELKKRAIVGADHEIDPDGNLRAVTVKRADGSSNRVTVN